MPGEARKARDAAQAPLQAVLPLFYRRPEALQAHRHDRLALATEPDFRFAADVNSVLILAGEFTVASRLYPIVFVGEPAMPQAVLGLERTNMFVDAQGQWARDRPYIPAYVRRYPFTFLLQPDQTTLALGLDMACDRLVDAGANPSAQALYADGKPTAFTQDALRFCGALQAEYQMTRDFVAALMEQDLLVEQKVRATTADGRPYGLDGFRCVDAAKFQALPDAIIGAWHRKGWLGLVHAHIASFACWQDLLVRAGADQPLSVEGA